MDFAMPLRLIWFASPLVCGRFAALLIDFIGSRVPEFEATAGRELLAGGVLMQWARLLRLLQVRCPPYCLLPYCLTALLPCCLILPYRVTD